MKIYKENFHQRVQSSYQIIEAGWKKADWTDTFMCEGTLTQVQDSEWAGDKFLALARYLWCDCYIDDYMVN